MIMEQEDDHLCFERVHDHTIDVLQQKSFPTLPSISTLEAARSHLLQGLPEHGLGVEETTRHLIEAIAPALNGSSLSPNYYGFVTGGVTPAARIADTLVALYDQSPQVHLPNQTIATNVENAALRLLMDLLRLDQTAWSGVFTTGATASNVLGLACGREKVVDERLKVKFGPDTQHCVAALGLLRACRLAEIEDIRVYTTMAHSSLYKASSILGLGRSSIQDVQDKDVGIKCDIQKLGNELASNVHNQASIVAVSCSDVNAGLFATQDLEDVQKLRKLCDNYGAWLHVDGAISPAFGIFARALGDVGEFETISQGGHGLELADSIAGDGHKLLNVPYDCGFFFCRDPNISQQVFQNPNAAYLSTKNAATDSIQSPLNLGLENSRRFRGLPVYATLMAYGRDGYAVMLQRQIRFARKVAAYLLDHDAFELLPREVYGNEAQVNKYTFIIVLFRAKDSLLNEQLVSKINASSKMYVSGTVWDGQTACRIAVANWQAEPDRDIEVVKDVLQNIVHSES